MYESDRVFKNVKKNNFKVVLKFVRMLKYWPKHLTTWS